MTKQIQDAYIVAATRLPVAKRNGMFRNVRPDDMLAHALKAVMAQAPAMVAHARLPPAICWRSAQAAWWVWCCTASAAFIKHQYKQYCALCARRGNKFSCRRGAA